MSIYIAHRRRKRL